MTFREYDDAFIWQCDKCRIEAVFPPNDFYARVAELKARGWSFVRDDESRVWSHRCWKCRETEAAEILNMTIPPRRRVSE